VRLCVFCSCITMETDSICRVIVEGQFTLDTKSKTLYSVVVDRKGINYTPVFNTALRRTGFLRRGVSVSEETSRLLFDSVVGCDCQRGNSDEDVSVYLVVHAYPRQQSSDGDFMACRIRVTLNLRFDKGTSYEENYQEASLWKTILSCLVRNVDIDPMTGKCDIMAQKLYIQCTHMVCTGLITANHCAQKLNSD